MNNKKNIENILPLVQRPGRYIGHEWNSHIGGARKDVSVCFCFPDMYELGASNLGIEILYHLVNQSSNAVAERCYAPAMDMEAALRKAGTQLFSLETGTPLKEFDIVGFGLPYELCSTNMLNMMDLAGIPMLSADRKETFPLVIGGGPLTANPEPLADFFDAFVLGDGEDAIQEIIKAAAEARKQGAKNKNDLLMRLAKIPGVYVPSLYNVAYNADGTVQSVAPVSNDVPATVNKCVVKLEESFFPSAQIVPFLQTVHNRLTLEIARGCPRKCRFCQATNYYWPWRVRSSESILRRIDEGLAATGYEEVAFASLSCTEYKGLDKLLSETNRVHGKDRISISIPSLRCDRFSLKVADNLGYNKRASLTFAPEAATDRLRDVIGKELSEEEIRDTLVLAWRMGWRLIKLYFMIGLPTEKDEDIEGINSLIRSIRQEAKGLNFNVTVSPFVPKAQTPFQWVAMAHENVLRARLVRLGKILPASIKSHHIDGSLLEGIFARGDRRLSLVLMRAWRKGCRFDQWKEHLQYHVWLEAFKEEGVDPEFYLYRERGADEVLPWDHLVFARDKKALREEYEKAIASSQLPASNKIKSEKVEEPVIVPPPVPVPMGGPALSAAQRVRFRISRTGIVRFLSHLEQIEVFRRAIRRAGLPVLYTAGFHPQPKISFGPAISVGYESDSEYLEFELSRRMEAGELQEKMKAALPDGYTLHSVKRVPLFFPSIDSLLNVACYTIAVSVSPEQIASFLAQNEIIIEKRKADRVVKIDVKPLLLELKADEGKLFMQLRFGPKRNVKPEKIVQALCGIDENQAKVIAIARTALLIEKRDGSLTEP